jgi:4-amino-4-deoxy-L-arabinose transferase-like glycosyltransferase
MGAMDSEAPAYFRNQKVDSGKLILIALLAVALLWRFVYFLEIYASPYGGSLTLDSEVYHQIGDEAAHGRWSSGETFFQAPLYPWALGAVYAIIGVSQTAAKLFQILLSVSSCWLIYRITDRAFDRTTAQVALAISSVYGMYIYFSNELLVVTLIVFLDLLGLELLLRAFAVHRQALWGAAGVVFGLSAIARPTILPFVAAVLFLIVITGWKSGGVRVVLLNAGVFALGVALPIAPVTVHNYLADGDLVLVAANGGVNFFIGNNPQSDGITAAIPGTRPDRRGARADQVRIAREELDEPHLTPRGVSGYWYDRAWSYIRDEPRQAIRHTAYKAFILANAHEVSNNRVIEFVTRYSSVFSWATLKFWLILPLALAGVVIGRGRSRQTTLLLIFAIVYAATVVPFFINARFRMPVVAVLIIFAAAAVVSWFRWLRTRPLDRHIGRRVAVSAAVALVTAIAIRPAPALRVPDAQAFFNEAEAFRARIDYANAARWYQKALDAYPGYCDAAFNLARIHAEIFPDPRRVVEVLESVVEPCAEDIDIRRLLGLSLCAVGRCDEGAKHLHFVAELDPGSEEARRELEWALSRD